MAKQPLLDLDFLQVTVVPPFQNSATLGSAEEEVEEAKEGRIRSWNA